MKATIEIPDELYRRVKAKSALDGRPVREVVMHLFEGWLGDTMTEATDPTLAVSGASTPAWFGAARSYAQRVNLHDLTSIRDSIAHGRARRVRVQRSERRRS